MRRSGLALVCFGFLLAPSVAGDIAQPAEAMPVALSPSVPARLIEIAGLDGIFEQFGRTLSGSARASGLGDERFLNAWEAATREAFGRAELAASLESGLVQRIDAAEASSISGFYDSIIGVRIAELEAATQNIAPERQIDAIAKGQALYLSAPVRRQMQIDELMGLSNAEFTLTLLAESLRGMAVGLYLAGNGDIDVPWEEIDAGVSQQLTGIRESLREASRAVMAYTYQPLSDDELEHYLQFMRAPATQKFYGVALSVIGTAIQDTMRGLGPQVAQKLAAVSI